MIESQQVVLCLEIKFVLNYLFVMRKNRRGNDRHVSTDSHCGSSQLLCIPMGPSTVPKPKNAILKMPREWIFNFSCIKNA